ncbi:MAG: hypothetical protein ACYCPT_13770 [Acidimicrobiales bacterium]
MRSRLAFSNGSEFEIWAARNCAVCQHDAPFRARGFDGDDGCELLAAAMMSDEEIPEWRNDPELVAAGVWPRVICSKFSPVEIPKGKK